MLVSAWAEAEVQVASGHASLAQLLDDGRRIIQHFEDACDLGAVGADLEQLLTLGLHLLGRHGGGIGEDEVAVRWGMAPTSFSSAPASLPPRVVAVGPEAVGPASQKPMPPTGNPTPPPSHPTTTPPTHTYPPTTTRTRQPVVLPFLPLPLPLPSSYGPAAGEPAAPFFPFP